MKLQVDEEELIKFVEHLEKLADEFNSQSRNPQIALQDFLAGEGCGIRIAIIELTKFFERSRPGNLPK